ncbi:MAG: hypothetical protein K0S70_809 [Microbacterium sp.]|jgi:hypothetical protein|nr:hypothetical protein [Microbacterium sp.]
MRGGQAVRAVPAARRTGLARRERALIELRYQPSAREILPVLRDRLLSQRPIVGDRKPRPGADGVTSTLLPIYGKSTFRNVIENGKHV